MSELDAKWRALVEAGKAEWAPGMRAIGRRNMPDACFRLEESVPKLMGEWSQAVPDWSDPATLGALLGQVRARWKDPATHAVTGATLTEWSDLGDWHVRGGLPWTQYGTGDTEAEALLAALEAAP